MLGEPGEDARVAVEGGGAGVTTKLNEELLADIADDALAEIAEGMLAEANTLRHNAGLARYELARRLRERDATHVDTEHWLGRLVPSPFVHTVKDPLALRDALEAVGLDPVRVRDAVYFPEPAPPQLRVDQRVLNELLKLGGAVKAVIEAHRQSERGEPKLELHRKADVISDGLTGKEEPI